MIERLRRQTWNWLPAFLEVAETGSVVRASKNLGLTAAAVSRTVRLLEEELGEPLFNRVGRSLALNQNGVALREAVRSATTAVDAGLTETLGDPYVGPLRVASIGLLTEHYVVPALIELKQRHPGLQPEHQNVGTAEANALVARGRIDVAFYYEALTAEHVIVERLGETTASVYCGRAHPLFERKRLRREDVLEHPFSVPQIGDTGRVMDGWPADVPRVIGMRITMLRSNLQVCLSGSLITVLPDVTAAPHVQRRELRKLPAPPLPPIEIFAARHEAARERGGARAVIDEVRARLVGRARRA